MATALSFSVPVDSLGSYIADALSSMSSYILIPIGLITGSAILMFGFKLLKQMKKSINCVPESVDFMQEFNDKQADKKRVRAYESFKERARLIKQRDEAKKRDLFDNPMRRAQEKIDAYKDMLDNAYKEDYEFDQSSASNKYKAGRKRAKFG